ncbi:Holliday junction branch migration protein RuvA [Anaerosporobacter sp.]|uniref:Holliday junction branch migration protein RuvA n=1 Tax=Anaerosporobacter sp. TaxID=1872529 RepID=UPI00286F6D1D|nr:Holliday junction branch migration protein RuvA [Anaerosporobacter sp.]
MISFIKGELDSIYEDGIVIENGGIGYDIKVPLSVMNELPAAGEEVKIYTYLYVREDILSLYGFLSRDDLQVFKLLITVNGIGPKGALGILSTISPDDLRFAVLADDAKAIAKAPGIGAKTASKLILELKDKLKLEDAFEQKLSKVADAPNSDVNAKNEAIQALVALGYTNTEALKAVRGIEITPDMDTEDILKLSLKKISFL